MYGDPEVFPVTQRDGKPLTANVPEKAVIPLVLGDEAELFTIADIRVLLSDFGESLNPTSDPRRGEYCHTPLASRPPEALFQPKGPLLFSADIWSLATCLWEILGMEAIFSSELHTPSELGSQQIDGLGLLPPA